MRHYFKPKKSRNSRKRSRLQNIYSTRSEKIRRNVNPNWPGHFKRTRSNFCSYVNQLDFTTEHDIPDDGDYSPSSESSSDEASGTKEYDDVFKLNTSQSGNVLTFKQLYATLKQEAAATKCAPRIHHKRYSCSLKVQDSLLSELRALGFEAYCLSGLVPKLGIREFSRGQISGVEAALKCSCQAIAHYRDIYDCHESNVRATMTDMCSINRGFFLEHLSYLRNSDGMSAASILKRITHIITLIKFFHASGHLEAAAFAEVISICNTQRTRFSRVQNGEHSVKTDPDMLLRQGMLTKHGVADFTAVMAQILPTYFALIKAMSDSQYEPTHKEFYMCTKIAVASLWLDSVNGRPQSVERMTVADADELLLCGSTASHHTKEFSSHGSQLILANENSRKVLRSYGQCLRKFALLRCHSTEDAVDIFFIGWSGKPFLQGQISEFVGDVLSWFGYSINGVTHIRRVVSTELQICALNGDISPAEHRNMIALQGHSPEVDQRYYNFMQRGAIVQSARNVCEKIHQCSLKRKSESFIAEKGFVADADAEAFVADNDADNDKEEDDWGLAHPHRNSFADNDKKDDDWGLAHPHRNSHRNSFADNDKEDDDWGLAHPHRNSISDSRIPWSPEERKVIASFVSKSTDKNKWAACLSFISSSGPSVRALFHPHHVRDSTLLRGAVRIKKVKGTTFSPSSSPSLPPLSLTPLLDES